MRTLDVYLAGKYIKSIFCDEQCDKCRWRFLCLTTHYTEKLKVTPNKYELWHYMVGDDLLEQGTHLMLCSHCSAIFTINNKQFMNNTKFRCPKCGRYNWGWCEEDCGVLIGVGFPL